MPLYVRDDEVRELATRFAAKRDCTVTEAVRTALKEALARDQAEIEDKRARVREILDRLDALPRLRENFSDKDLYDENGLPIL